MYVEYSMLGCSSVCHKLGSATMALCLQSKCARSEFDYLRGWSLTSCIVRTGPHIMLPRAEAFGNYTCHLRDNGDISRWLMYRYATSKSSLYLLSAELPYNDYFEYFGPDFKLHISPTNMTNQNTREYLNKIKGRLFENLRLIPHVPSVQMQSMPIWVPLSTS